MTLLQQHKEPTEASRPSFTSFWMRSTIHRRHVARRVKTLANANDTRPALFRILAQIPVAKSFVPPYSPTAAAAALPKMHSGDMDSSSVDFFTVHTHVPPSTKTLTPATQNSSSLIIAFSAAAAATAKLADRLVMDPLRVDRGNSRRTAGSSSWRTLSNSHSTPPSHRLRPDRFSKLAIFLPKFSSGNATVPAGENIMRRPLPSLHHHIGLIGSTQRRNLMAIPSIVPVFLLFGTQAWVERRLSSTIQESYSRGDAAAPLVFITAAGVAGAAAGIAQHGRSVMIGSEVMASILYFGTYRLLKSVISGNIEDVNQSNNGIIAIAVAGAVTGALSEVWRGLGTTTGSSSFVSSRSLLITATDASTSPFVHRTIVPHSVKGIAMRAAPAHALLFLGYEGALTLLTQTPDC